MLRRPNRLLTSVIAVVVASAGILPVGLGSVSPAAAVDITAELALTKAVNPNLSPYAPGDTFSYTISLTCNSNLSAVCNDARLKDALPAPLVFDPAVPNPVSVGGASATSIAVGANDFTIDFTESTEDGVGLASGENMTVTVFVQVPNDATAEFNGKEIVNTASASATNADPQSESATITVNVVEKLDSSVLKSVDDNQPPGTDIPGVPNQPVDYTIGGGNASNRAVDTIVVQDPADGAASALAGYLDFQRIGSITPPTDADQVKIEYLDPSGTWQLAVDTSPIPVDTSGIPNVAPLTDVKGLRFTFSSSAGQLPVTPPNGEALIVVQTSTNASVETIPSGQTAIVSNTASSLVTVGPTFSPPRTAEASVVISNALPDVGVTKSFFDNSLLAGESTVAQITATNGNLEVVSMLITEPSPGQPNLLDQGLDFSGFTSGVEWPAGATEATVTYHYADGSVETRSTRLDDNLPPPTRPGVVGFDVLFTGAIEPNSSADLPFTVTARPIDGTSDVVSTNETTATVIDANGRTAVDTGADTITLQPARVSTTIDKRIARDDLFAVPGSTTNVTLLAAVNDRGDNASTIGSDSLVITDPDPAGGSTPFWNTFDVAQITAGVPGNANMQAEYFNGTTWVTFDGAAAIAGATTWVYPVPVGLRDTIQGVRFTYTPKTGELPPGFTVAPTLSTTMRSEFRDGSGSVADAAAAAPAPGLAVDNRAQSAVSNPDDADPSDNTATDADNVVLKPIDGTGPDLLEKSWLNDQVFAFSDEQRTARVKWSTEGLPFSSVAITDPSSSGEISDVSTSVYDAFDLARIEPIGILLDSSMRFDRISKLELNDGTGWVDITLKACSLLAACDGAFPGYTLTDAERASTLGVRITYGEGSHRDGLLGPAAGSGVAASFGIGRGLDLTYQIRQAKRSDGGPVVGILHDDTYNSGVEGVVDNTVSLTGVGPVPVTQGDSAPITILDTTVNVSVTKIFDQTELPVPAPGTPAGEFPLVTSTITARNETESKIGLLEISDPSPSQPAPTAYQYLNLYSIDDITVPAGATQSIVTLLRPAGAQTYTIAEAQALTPADLVDVIGFRVAHSDPTRAAVESLATSVVRLTFQSREVERSPLDSTPRVDVLDRAVNVALASVERPGGDPNLDSASGTATDTVAFVEATYGVTASKTITPGSRYEDEARTGYRLTLVGQPTGNVRTKTMTLTDATPTFWNAFDFAGFPQVTLPVPVRQLRVSVLLGVEYQTTGGALEATCNGSTDLTACWTVGAWQTAPAGGAITPILPAGMTADQVRGVRFDVRRNAANANWERPRNPIVTLAVNTTRRTVLHLGPDGQIDSYPVPSTLPGLQTAPGETAQGTTTNDLQVHGVGAWGIPDVGTTWTADAADSDSTTLRHRVNAITVEKSPGNGQAGAAAQQFPPNSPIPYAMTITNSGAWAMTGLTLTDTIGTNGQGSLLVEPAGATDTFGFTIVSGAGVTRPTTGFAASLDPVTGVIAITVPGGFIFTPGDKLTITAALIFQTGLAPTTPVGNSITASSDRDFETCSFTRNNRPAIPNTTDVDLCTATTTVTPSAAAPIQVVKAVKGVGAGVPGAAPTDANYDDLGVLATGRTPIASTCATPNAGRGYYTNACVPITRPGGVESWRSTFTNLGNIRAERLVAIDVLPAPGDTGVTVGTQRGSNWAPTLLGQVATTAAPGAVLTAYYLNTVPNRACNAKDIENSARTSALPTTDPCQADVSTRAWRVFTVTTPASQLAAAKAVKFVVNFPTGAGLAPRESFDISFQTRTAWLSPSTGAGTLPIAWNAIAAGSRGTGNGVEVYLGPVEPVRTGVAMPTARISLAKTVVKPTGWTATTPSTYSFTMSCSSGGQPVPIVDSTGATAATVTLLADGTVLSVGASLNIPLYADCAVREAPSQGATISYVPAGADATVSGAITALTDFTGRTDIHHPFAAAPVPLQRIQTTNTYELAGFSVSKTVRNGGAVDQDGAAIVYDPFPFRAVCTFLDATVLDATFTLNDPLAGTVMSSRTFDSLPSGADCTVTETDNHGASTTMVVTRGGSAAAPVTGTRASFTLLADDAQSTHVTSVAVTNTFTVGSLAITKSATGVWAGQFGDFTVQVVCTLAAADPGTVFSDTAVLTKDAPGNVWRIDDLPTGTSCAITETDDGGATQSTVTPASVVIGASPAGPVAVAVANVFRVGGFSVSKTVAGSGVPTFSDGPFEFSYRCSYEGRTVGTGDLEVAGDGTAGPFLSATVSGLPVGATCIVSESANGGADTTAPDVTVTIPDAQDEAPQVASAAFVNRFTAGTITVTKVLDGPAAGEDWVTDATYTVHVTCEVEQNGSRVGVFDGDVELTGADTVTVQNPVNDGDLLLPFGTHCWGDETDAGGATSSAIDFDSYVNAAIVTAQAGTNPQPLVITATNTFAYGSLVLSKALGGDPTHGAGRTFEIRVTCTFDRGVGNPPLTIVDHQLTRLQGGQSARFDGLPIGSNCWAEEADSQGAWEVQISGTEAAPVVISAAGGDVTLTVTNIYRDAGFTVSKAIDDGGAVDQDGDAVVYDLTYSFTASCLFLGDETIPIGDRAFTLREGQAKDFSGLPAGADCTVSETGTGGAPSTSIVITVGGVAGMPIDGTDATFGLLPDAGGGHVTDLAVTNVYTVGSVEITKHVTGAGADAWGTGDFSISLLCTLPDAETNPVFDATNVMTRLNPLWTVGNLPTGAVCSVAELDDAGATGSSVSPVGTFLIGDSTEPPQMVAVTNDFRVGGLNVVKTLIGSGVPDFSDGPFLYSVVCTYESIEVYSGTLTLAGDGTGAPITSSTISGIPVGAVCVVRETDDGGADKTPAPVTVTIPDETAGIAGVVSAAFVNEFSLGTVTISKLLDGAAQKEDWATSANFVMQVTCQMEGPAGTVLTIFDGPVTVRGGETVLVTDAEGNPLHLPYRTHCFGAEKDAGGATSSSVDYDSFDNAAIVTVADAPQELRITAINVFAYGSLDLSKVITGATAQAIGKRFHIELTCTLQRGANPVAVVLDRKTVILSGGETRRFDALPIGAGCWAQETDQGGAATVTISATKANPAVVTADGVVAITIENRFDPPLAGTGADGDALRMQLTTATVLLLGGAAVGLLALLRRRRRHFDS